MTGRFGVLTVAAVLFAAIVIQTTLFGRINLGGISPDLAMLVIVLLALRVRPESLLFSAFVTGMVLDALGSNPLGLRALVLTVVAFAATRTTDRADFSPLAAAVWVGILTLGGVVLLIVLGSLVSQLSLEPGEAMRRIMLVPILNFALAVAAWPMISRLLEPARRMV